MTNIVIVGAGQAGGSAALQLRSAGFEGALTLIGAEPHPPYERPPLSKAYLTGDLAYNSLLLRPLEFYRDQNVQLLTDTSVTSINLVEKVVMTSDKQALRFDKLLLATGARPRQLPISGADLPGVHYLRTLGDVAALQNTMRRAQNVCLIGGGYVGLEFASVARKAGLKVTVLEAADRLLQRVTTPEMSEYFADLHRSHGVEVCVGARIQEIQGAHQVERVVCEHGTVTADLVLIGIGAQPNVEIAEAAGLACDNGIQVDEMCRSSHPDVFAAGDCTNHPNALLKRRLRLESAPNATDQARVAATNMMGANETYCTVPWFWSDQYTSKLQAVGFSSDGTQSICRGDKAAHQFAMFYLKENRLVAVEAINSAKAFMAGKRLYGHELDPDQLADPATDLRSLIKSVA